MLAAQYYMLTFLPLSHPQSYLPLLFRLWDSVNSYLYDERMLQFLARIAETHVDPLISDPKRVETIPDDEISTSEGEGRPHWNRDDMDTSGKYRWSGLYKDVGVFTDREWNFLMCKCLASMGAYCRHSSPGFFKLSFDCRDTTRRLWFPHNRSQRGQSGWV